MQVTLIHNAKAGDEQLSGDELVAIIRDAGHDVAYYSAKDDDWNEALPESADLIAVAGGDGTVGQVAKQLFGRQIPIAVLPMGTANNISKTLGFANKPIDRLVKEWKNAKSIGFDGAIVTTPWGSTRFIESLGIGLFASMMSQASKNNSTINHSSAEGEIITALQMVQERLQSYPLAQLNIRLDGQDLSGEYILLEAMNIRYVSSNLHLAPDANVGDGLLDVILLSEGDRRKLDTYLFHRLATKLHPQERHFADELFPPELPTYRGKQLQIQCQDIDIHIDDEMKSGKDLSSSAMPIEIDVKVSPNALEFLVPA